MVVSDILKNENFKLVTNNPSEDQELTGVYIGDLLSWVMGKAKPGNAWITIQGHINIIAVALLTEVSCIIISENAQIEENALEKANLEDITIFKTKLSSYEVAKIL